ncbi:AAA family ATPase [Erythrobacter arachoides]|uniref:AAA family ATPase n=1 Tax=Aurantiacibacter arachoides TaxID=1850444 RepID=A0A845A2V7_9SPHN|nr:AAA family ATPase [Aurantiacibacter arachoides]MXO94268.1 AAA family ATPase [Aurantiacibacter arachoides]GGD64828.1 hypothetical protein GCM10011411_26400 [Aurantiacibacter arachoides]
MKLTSSQERETDKVVAAIRKDGVGILTGAAGTGKTTVARSAITKLGLTTADIVLCAVTHKAKNVIADAFPKDTQISTICALVKEMVKINRDETLEGKRYALAKMTAERRPTATNMLELERAARKYNALQTVFFRARDNLNHLDRKPSLVVVDEASMVGIEDARLLRRLGVKLLVLGDPNQIGPVNDEMGFDLKNAHGHLTKIMRTDRRGIIDLSQALLRGQSIKGPFEDVAYNQYDAKDAAIEVVRGDAVYLVYTNPRRQEINAQMRAALRMSPFTIYAGEKLMITKPHGDARNGDEFFVTETVNFDETTTAITVATSVGPMVISLIDILGSHLNESQKVHVAAPVASFTYALTTHKSQGSAWNKVYVDIGNIRRSPEYKNLAYTAVTRARKSVVLIGA